MQPFSTGLPDHVLCILQDLRTYCAFCRTSTVLRDLMAAWERYIKILLVEPTKLISYLLWQV
jgi:hypothetical protein